MFDKSDLITSKILYKLNEEKLLFRALIIL